MPNEERCDELNGFLENLSVEDNNFVMWRMSKVFADVYEYEKDKIDTSTLKEFRKAYMLERMQQGLKLVHEVLSYEW